MSGTKRLARAVQTIGAVRPKDAAAALAELSRYEVNEVATAIVHEKAVHLTLERLRDLSESLWAQVRGSDVMVQRLATLSGVERSLPDRRVLLSDLANDLGFSILEMKGLAAQPWYRNPSHRDIGDIDLMLETPDDAFALTAELLKKGFSIEEHELPWLKATPTGRLYGQINLRPPIGTDGHLDIHFGAYSVRHCAMVPNEPTRVGGGTGLGTEDSTSTVLHLTGNAAGDYFILAKEMNDLVVALERSDINWDAVSARLHGAGLDGFFRAMLRGILDMQDLDQDQVNLARGLMSQCGREIVRPPKHAYWGDAHWRRRWVGTALHSFRFGHRTSLIHGLTCARTAIDAYRKRTVLQPDPRYGVFRVEELVSWRCVRLIPIELALSKLKPEAGTAHQEKMTPTVRDGGRVSHLSDMISVTHLPDGDLVKIGGSFFIPTVDFRINTRILGSTR